jgi:hypothetical protein
MAIRTATLDIETTAPELMLATAPKFAPGDQVRHRKFGLGRVVSAETDAVLIEFPTVGKKQVKPTFVRKVEVPQAAA